MKRLFIPAALVAIIAFLALAGGYRDGALGAPGAGQYNSMTQQKTVEPCVAHTTLTKTADKATASPGEDITYTITETNDSSGSCLLDTSVPSDGILDTLRVVGAYTLENRSGAGSTNAGSTCGATPDPRDTCVNGVLDWIETHNAGAGNNWNVLHATPPGGTSNTVSGNQLTPPASYYCPQTDSFGPLPAPYAPGYCSESTQPLYGTLSMNGGALTTPFALPCGQPAGSSCHSAPQVITYTMTVPLTPAQVALLQSCGAPSSACDGIRNVVHFDMFNEQISTSGRNHFARASFTGAQLDATAYDIVFTDSPPQPPTFGNDSCAITSPPAAVGIPCVATATGWTVGTPPPTLDLPGGFSASAQIVYTVRADDCGRTIGNTVSATHNDLASRYTVPGVYTEGPAVAQTTITSCPAEFSSNTQGFWQSRNGDAKLDRNGDNRLDTPVSIGGGARGENVTHVSDPGPGDAVSDSHSVLGSPSVSCQEVAEASPCSSGSDSGLGNPLANLYSQTLALTYNCVYYASACGTATLTSIDGNLNPGCDQTSTAALAHVQGSSTVGTVLHLTGANTISSVLSLANTLINDSRVGAPVVTQDQVGAMNYLLGTYVNCDRGSDPPGDVDWDGVLDVGDNCVGKYNPDQEDVDGDGIGDMCDADADNDSGGVTIAGDAVFGDGAESYMGTDTSRDCGLDAWGPDFDGDGSVTIFDVGTVKATFASSSGDGTYANRDDLSADGYINVLDLALMKAFLGDECQGVDSIDPGAP